MKELKGSLTRLPGLSPARMGDGRVGRDPEGGEAPGEGGTAPTGDTPPDLAGAQRQLTVLQWVIPGLTGAALVLNALMDEQRRPQQVTSGVLPGLRSRIPVLALAGTGLLASGWSRRANVAAGAPVVLWRRAVTLTASPTLLQQTSPDYSCPPPLVLC
jgi:hypothetical protein